MPTKTTKPTGQLYITKLAAAERQLNAAIRMALANEDQLAIHTIAAAAYRVLRDLKLKRGQDDLADQLGLGLYAIASDLASRRISAIPADFDPALAQTVEAIATHMRNGKSFTPADAAKMFRGTGNPKYWRDFNATANFLKHADNDSSGLISLDKVQRDNVLLLLSASSAYLDLIGHSTPEIEAIAVFALGGDEGFSSPFWSGELSERFRKSSSSKRRHICRLLLRTLKKQGLRGEVVRET